MARRVSLRLYPLTAIALTRIYFISKSFTLQESVQEAKYFQKDGDVVARDLARELYSLSIHKISRKRNYGFNV